MSIGSPIRTLIVDDERLARRALQRLLTEMEGVDVIGEADGVATAVDRIDRDRPDLVLLDIRMPDGSGFDVVEQSRADCRYVFVTAHDDFAVRAFEVEALDYLVKPVHAERLREAVYRAAISKEEDGGRRRPAYLFLSLDDEPRLVSLARIVSISAAGDYTRVLLSDGSGGLILRSLKAWEKRLPDDVFVRIHRSTIVNLSHVQRLEPWFRSSYRVFLAGSSDPVFMSRRYASRLRARLGMG